MKHAERPQNQQLRDALAKLEAEYGCRLYMESGPKDGMHKVYVEKARPKSRDARRYEHIGRLSADGVFTPRKGMGSFMTANVRKRLDELSVEHGKLRIEKDGPSLKVIKQNKRTGSFYLLGRLYPDGTFEYVALRRPLEELLMHAQRDRQAGGTNVRRGT